MRGRHNLPSPTLGVSTLAARNQPEGMMISQVNMRSDPIRKLSRRPAMEYIQQLDTVEWKAYHEYTRGGVDIVIGVTTTGAIKVFHDGVLQITDETDYTAGTYLSEPTTEQIKFHTIADTTFIANTLTEVRVVNVDVGANALFGTYINVVAALNYGEEIRVDLRWATTSTGWGNTSDSITQQPSQTFTITIPNADAGDYEAADEARATRAVATAISNALSGLTYYRFINGVSDGVPFGAEFTTIVAVKGSVVSIYSPGGALPGLVLEADSGQGNSSIKVISTTIQTTEGLPKYALDGSLLRVSRGSVTDGAYALQAVAIDDIELTGTDTLREVVWEEAAWVGNNHLVGTTMPVVITQEANAVTVANVDSIWTPRGAGDLTSNEAPRFVNQTIQAMATFQGRLAIGTGDEVMLSNTDDIFLFFRKSVLQLLATDVVALGSTTTNADDLTSMTVFNNDLVVNFPKAQFKVSGASAVTPHTTAMTPLTKYNTQALPAPVQLAGQLMLPFSYGDSGGIWQLAQNAQNEQSTASALTRLVEGIMDSDIELWTASSSQNMLVVKGVANNKLYVYEQATEGNQRTQMAWSTWELNVTDTILGMNFKGNQLQLVTVANGVTTLRHVDLKTVQPDAEDNIYLDDMLILSVADGATTVNLPTGYPEHANLLCVQSSDCKSPYYKVTTSRNGLVLTVPTTIHKGGTPSTVYVGVEMTSEFTPTRQYLREEGRVVDIDKLRIKKYWLDVVHTSEMTMDTVSKYYDTMPYQIRAEQINVVQLGTKAFHTGYFPFSFRKDAATADARFYTSGYLPMNVIGITWEGLHKQRTRRL